MVSVFDFFPPLRARLLDRITTTHVVYAPPFPHDADAIHTRSLLMLGSTRSPRREPRRSRAESPSTSERSLTSRSESPASKCWRDLCLTKWKKSEETNRKMQVA